MNPRIWIGVAALIAAGASGAANQPQRANGRRLEPIATERFQAEVGTEIGGRRFRSCAS